MATKQLVNQHNAKLIALLASNKPWKSFLTGSRRCYSNDKSAEKETLQTEQQATNAATDDLKNIAENVETLNKNITELKEKNEELLDKYRRSLAENENLRVRMNKQIADAKIFGIQSFCKDLLEVADSLGHATKSVPQEQLNSNSHLKNLYEGLTMTNASLMQVFKRHGLEPMNPLNEKYNPHLHEALFLKPDTTVAPDTIVEVTKLGYKLHERVIRPASVGVSKS